MPHKLLLADDSVTIQRVIELTFADEGVQVSVVGDGNQAIDRIQSERPDIVLADVGMPGRDGYEVAEFIKSNPQLADIPVVLLTGAFEPIDEDRARNVGCDAVLVKPFEPQMVISRVKELLAAPRPARVVDSPAPPAPTAEGVNDAADHAHTEQKGDGDSLEDYFDRLDAAFATLSHTPKRAAATAHEVVGDLDEGPRQPPEPVHSTPEPVKSTADPLISWDPEVTGDLAPGPQPDLASAFAALLAAEQGQPLPIAPSAPASALSEEAMDEIVRRVLAKMADDSLRRLVMDTAERLVREEIERIKRS